MGYSEDMRNSLLDDILADGNVTDEQREELKKREEERDRVRRSQRRKQTIFGIMTSVIVVALFVLLFSWLMVLFYKQAQKPETDTGVPATAVEQQVATEDGGVSDGE